MGTFWSDIAANWNSKKYKQELEEASTQTTTADTNTTPSYANSDTHGEKGTNTKPNQSMAEQKPRTDGWYRLDQSPHARTYLAKQFGHDFPPLANSPDYFVRWTHGKWEDWIEKMDAIPAIKNLKTLDTSRGYTNSIVPEAMLRLIESDLADDRRIVDYLSHLPTHYSTADDEEDFSKSHLNRWNHYFSTNGLPRPDFRFSSFYLDVDEYYGSPGDLSIESVSSRLPLPKDTELGHESFVRGVVGIGFVKGYLGEVDDSIEYNLLAWTDMKSASNAIHPVYEGLTAAESFVVSAYLNFLLTTLPLVSDRIGVDESNELQRLLQTIHHPSIGTLASARSKLNRERCLELLRMAFGELEPPMFLVDDHSRMNIYSAGAIEEAYSGLRTELPPARMVKTFTEAEFYAAEVMESLGFTGVSVTPTGADEGIDVSSREALAQVKMEGVKTSREKVQRLTGICSYYDQRAIFFSLSGYTSPAIEWADKTDTACFEFQYDGTITPRSAAAKNLL